MAPSDEDKDHKKSFSAPGIFSVLGWIMGGLSFLNLIRDLTPLKLYGLVAEWVDAYGSLVRTITKFLFGWIEIWWLKVSVTEAHLLVLLVVVLSAQIRVHHGNWTNMGWLAVALLLSVLLPEAFSFLLLYGVAFVQLSHSAISGDALRIGNPSSFRREMLGVLGVVALLVVINYAVFAPR